MSSWLLVLPLLLSVASVAALVYQVRAWGRLPLIAEDRERAFRRTQLRRRMQVSAMLALIGLGMIAGMFIPSSRPNLFVGFWCGLMLLVLWVMVLALVDARANYHFWTSSRRRVLVEQAKLKAQLVRRDPEPRNGHHPE